MASVNYSTKEISVKIVYYGPAMSGKTTNLIVLHQRSAATAKSEMVSLMTNGDRTIFFDFLPLCIGKVKDFSIRLHLYTVPGQTYYHATRTIVLHNVDGIVFVADSAPDRLDDNVLAYMEMQENLAFLKLSPAAVPVVMQYNKRDVASAVPCTQLDEIINTQKYPSFDAIAMKNQGVTESLKLISNLVFERLNVRYAHLAPGAASSRSVRARPPRATSYVHQPLLQPMLAGATSPVRRAYLPPSAAVHSGMKTPRPFWLPQSLKRTTQALRAVSLN